MDGLLSKLFEQGPFGIVAAMLLLLFYYKDKALTDSKNQHLDDVKEMTSQMLAATLTATQSMNTLTTTISRMLDLQEERSKTLDDMARTISALQKEQTELLMLLRTRQMVGAV